MRPIQVLIVAVVLGGTQSAGADDHLERGLQHYQDGEFELAIDEFSAGYELDPQPELLFALAQAERLSGDCASASVYYREFLDTDPPDAQRDAATMHLDACDDALSSTPNRDQEVLEIEVPAPELQSRRWFHDVVGDVMLGAGALSALISFRLYGQATSERDLAEAATDYSEYTTHRDRALSRRNWALGTFGIGAGLMAGAVYRFVWGGRDERDLAVGPSSDGIGLSLGGAF
jgi:tetratricopeptide (TPR) repeat protein